MKTVAKFAGLIVFGALAVTGCAKKHFTSWSYIEDPEVTFQLKNFVAEKMAQANSATNEPAPGFAAYFAAAQKGDWLAVSNEFNDFANHAPQYQHSGTDDTRLRGTSWDAVVEIWGAMDAFAGGGQKYSALYANNIIESIPSGSIYFGGTDAGRFLITAMQKSQVDGDPFFTLTQNALADGSYLDYLRSMYGDKIYIPTAKELQQCYKDYTDDALKRQQNHQLKRGENIKIGPDGNPQVSGAVAVMTINGLLAKIIFDKNANQDFYIQQSFPLDWMYPYLEPHGQIFKLDREPLTVLSVQMVQDDHDYWKKTISPMIGNWLNEDTTVAKVTAFDEKVFHKHDFSGFTGDRHFFENEFAYWSFSKDRLSIAELYTWRMNHATGSEETDLMAQAADFAFRQALALCPYSPEVIARYEEFLKGQGRRADAALVDKMAKQLRRRT